MNNQSDDMFRVHHIESPHGLRYLLVVSLFRIDHIQLYRQISTRIRDDGIREFSRYVLAIIFDVVHPVYMALQWIARMAQELDVTFLELRVMDCQTTQFSRADGGEVRRVGKQKYPAGEYMI